MPEGFRVNVKGYREVLRALNAVDQGTRTAVLAGLMKAAEPVTQDARARLRGYPGLSVESIMPRAVARGVYITQKHGRTTGTRPDFGALQMRVGLIPAATDGKDEFTDRVDDALGILISKERLS
jgi:hypothetical protein